MDSWDVCSQNVVCKFSDLAFVTTNMKKEMNKHTKNIMLYLNHLANSTNMDQGGKCSFLLISGTMALLFLGFGSLFSGFLLRLNLLLSTGHS